MTLTPEQVEAGETEIGLTPFNQEVIECFRDFIKYNIYLQHLDLQSTGLIPPAIKFIVTLLRKSQALRCLHLCGNKGLTDDLFIWIRERIHARPYEEPHSIMPTKN